MVRAISQKSYQGLPGMAVSRSMAQTALDGTEGHVDMAAVNVRAQWRNSPSMANVSLRAVICS